MKRICLLACLLASSPAAVAIDCRITWDPYDGAAKVAALPNAKVTQRERWVVATQGNGAAWAATKPSHPAHPAVVRRCAARATEVKCLAAGSLCAPLAKEFEQLLGSAK